MDRAFVLSLVLAVLVLYVQGGVVQDESATPPPYDQYALMARYIVREAGWLEIATISTREGIEGYPFISLKSHSDGVENNSTGTPYLYMTDMDVSAIDIAVNNKVTVLVTLASTDYCDTNEFDPQDPQCAKVIITGSYERVDDTSDEYAFGQEALFYRHPVMKTWPANHEFYVAKIIPEQMMVLDYYGGISTVTPEDYFDADLNSYINN